MPDDYGLQITKDGGIWLWKWGVRNLPNGDFKIGAKMVDLITDLPTRSFVAENFVALYSRPGWV
jgi:hypothetical protein